jgi:excisionase family DNA binding protein
MSRASIDIDPEQDRACRRLAAAVLLGAIEDGDHGWLATGSAERWAQAAGLEPGWIAERLDRLGGADEDPDLLTVKQAAARIGVSGAYIHNRIHAGDLRAVMGADGTRRIRAADADQLTPRRRRRAA